MTQNFTCYIVTNILRNLKTKAESNKVTLLYTIPSLFRWRSVMDFSQITLEREGSIVGLTINIKKSQGARSDWSSYPFYFNG